MIKGFSVKNILIGGLAGVLIATNFHEEGLSAAEIALWASMLGTVVWIAVEDFEIRMVNRINGKRYRRKRC